jgi:hypothetical protein
MYEGGEFKETDWYGKVMHHMWEWEMHTKIWAENLKDKDLLWDLCTDGTILLI